MGGPSRGQIARAVLESSAFTIRANMEQLERESGITASNIALGGGLSRSSTFREILPEVLDRPISMYSQSNVTARGCAAIARAALGEFKSLSESAMAASQDSYTSVADDETAIEYQGLYEDWLELNEEVGPLLT